MYSQVFESFHLYLSTVKYENNFQTSIIKQYPELKGICVAHEIVKIGENKKFSDGIINTGKMENCICQSTWGLENASFSWKCCDFRQMVRRLKLGTITITPEILGWFGPQCLQSSCHLIFTITLGLRYYSHDSYHKTFSDCLKNKNVYKVMCSVYYGMEILWTGYKFKIELKIFFGS